MSGLNISDERPITLGTGKARIALEYWGLSPEAATGITLRMNQRLPNFDWHTGAAQSGTEDLTIHVVDIEPLIGREGNVMWNAYGPIEAMHQAQKRGLAAFALCRGPLSRFPMNRRGCWAMEGQAGWENALEILLRSLAVTQWNTSSGKATGQRLAALRRLAAQNLTCTLAVREKGGILPRLGSVLAASLMPPTLALVAGLDGEDYRTQLTHAGAGCVLLASIPLDNTPRTDFLFGFRWPALD